jgi:hypothetical protein
VVCGNRLAATVVMAAIVVSAGVSVWAFRGLYADGALYAFNILRTADFSHASETRISATYLTQYPLVAAVRLGLHDIRLLIRLYTATLFAVPVVACLITTWFSRRDPLLFSTNLTFIFAVFYTTNFEIIGEYHVLYSLYWCAFVLLITGRCDVLRFAGLLPLIGIVLTRSYEISVILCPILSLLCLWRTRVSNDPAARAILLVSAYLFAVGAWFGLQGSLFPRDPANAGNFTSALFVPAFYIVPVEIAALFALAAAANLAVGWWRVAAVAAVLIATARFAWRHFGAAHVLSLGPAYVQRATVVPIILVLSLLGLLSIALERRWPRLASVPVLFALLPAAMVFAVDLHDTIGWKAYMNAFCETLATTASAEQRLAFPRKPQAQKYGWSWTYPTMSILLRPAGSQAIVTDADHDSWQPFDPNSPIADLSVFKTNGGICGP